MESWSIRCLLFWFVFIYVAHIDNTIPTLMVFQAGLPIDLPIESSPEVSAQRLLQEGTPPWNKTFFCQQSDN